MFSLDIVKWFCTLIFKLDKKDYNHDKLAQKSAVPELSIYMLYTYCFTNIQTSKLPIPAKLLIWSDMESCWTACFKFLGLCKKKKKIFVHMFVHYLARWSDMIYACLKG